MKKEFSTSWKSSKKPRKQRKYRFNAPLHIKRKFMNVHLSKELKQKYSRRAIAVRKGDTVKIVRGQFKKKTGKIEIADIKKTKVYISGIEIEKKDGTKAYYPIHPSNLVITALNIDDKKRVKSLERKQMKNPEKNIERK